MPSESYTDFHYLAIQTSVLTPHHPKPGAGTSCCLPLTTDQLSKDRRAVTLLRRAEHVLPYPQGRTCTQADKECYNCTPEKSKVSKASTVSCQHGLTKQEHRRQMNSHSLLRSLSPPQNSLSLQPAMMQSKKLLSFILFAFRMQKPLFLWTIILIHFFIPYS